MGFKCEIKFNDNSDAIYYVGQNVAGTIKFSLDAPKKVSGMYVKISGYARTYWSVPMGVNRRINFYGREDYLDTKTYLLGSEAGSSIEIPPGDHKYTFGCSLSPRLPTSFENKYGYIRYSIEVTFERSWKFNHTFQTAFTVIQPVNLNDNSVLYTLPVQVEHIHRSCCWPCEGGPVKFEVTAPVTGFVPGQKIPIKVLIENEANDTFSGAWIDFVRIIRYFSQPPLENEKQEDEVIGTTQISRVEKLQNKVFDFEVVVPSTPPTNMDSCKIIQIAYILKVAGRFSSLGLAIPITIGTIPLNTTILNQSPSITYEPSEELNMRFDRFEDNRTGERRFSPMYPMYHFNPNESVTEMAKKSM